eukprot:TRINITY_DN8691_c0_g1_i1.p1 TRINITY_DN8691_c0_g1~~TRINITY_DN8691_c0_g1_i1.p1  ORF type:complete len:820 (+),score=227.71 TRINITY_DN8691_c0_g1_i1:325-2460(+)
MDVSDLVDSMIMVSTTQNLILKKMVYLFLSHYARENEHMALLSINSVMKDGYDDSPMIRGMSIRWLSSLRSTRLVEYMLEPVKRGLIDKTAYVRRNAALACAKIYHLNSDVMKDPAILNKLYELIRDKDAGVIVNSLRALDEILEEEGGVALNQKIVIHLLSKLNEFNPWGRSFVLDLLQQYQPNDEEELFGILNILDNYFTSSHSSIVLGTVHLFLLFTQTKPELHDHVYLRIKNPLLTVMVGASVELLHVVLSHIYLITKRIPTMFSSDYKMFYPKDKEPAYLKLLKIKLLKSLANETNARDILSELGANVMDKDITVSNAAIQAIGQIAFNLPIISEFSLELLLGFLELEQLQHILATTLVVMKDMLRQFPDQAHDIVPRLARNLEIVKETEAIAAIVTMIGEYGQIIEDGPYILEEVIFDWEKHDSKVKNQLIVGTLKLFFKRPVEMKPILSKLFSKSLEDFSHPDVHDRALLYYRLLSSNVEKCRQTLFSIRSKPFSEVVDEYETDAIFEEFNTLSVVYNQTSDRFIRYEGFEDELKKEESESVKEKQAEQEYYKRQEEERQQWRSEEQQVPRTQTYMAPSSFSSVGGGGPSLSLNPAASMDPASFEKAWRALQIVDKSSVTILGRMTTVQQIDSIFVRNNIKSVAKGGSGTFKFFLYCQESSGVFIFVEAIINTTNKSATATYKSVNVGAIPLFKAEFEKILQQL